MGLLLSHKRKLLVWNDMLSVSGLHEGERSGGGKRGEVEVFSAGSRYRLFRLLHQLEFERVTFITLTYPRQYPADAKVYKANLKEWHRRFDLAYPGLQAVWRLEFQKRGAPHFHVMILDCPFIPIEDMCWMWKCVVHSTDMAHERNGVDLKLIVEAKEKRLIAKYLSKYIAKIDKSEVKNHERKCGRWWGKWNITKPEPFECEISDWQAERIVSFALDACMGNQDWRPIDPTLCSVFGNSLGSGLFNQLIRGYKTILERS